MGVTPAYEVVLRFLDIPGIFGWDCILFSHHWDFRFRRSFRCGSFWRLEVQVDGGRVNAHSVHAYDAYLHKLWWCATPLIR